jgi:hypothetical protein
LTHCGEGQTIVATISNRNSAVRIRFLYESV